MWVREWVVSVIVISSRVGESRQREKGGALICLLFPLCFLLKYFINVCVCAYTFLCLTVFVYIEVPVEARGVQYIFLKLELGNETLIWVLWTKFRSSGRSVSTLNFWAISPVPSFCFLWGNKCISVSGSSETQVILTICTEIKEVSL